MTNSISKIGLGTVQFGIPYGISNKHGQTSELEVSSILKTARKVGINTLDTANSYGTSEKVLGQNNIADFKIVSKFLRQHTNQNISDILNESLKNLNVTAIYGYMAHRPMDVVQYPNIWDELNMLKQNGTIQKIGFSFNEIFEIEEVLKIGFNPDIIQVPYNYLDHRFESYMKELKNQGCEIHTRSAFLQGLFFMETQKLTSFFDEIKPIIEELQKTIEDLPTALLQFCIHKPFIDKVIFGVNTNDQLKSNIQGISNTLTSLPENNTPINDSILIPSKWPK
jgi:aryl-alcohol dehydrogenase-like predicted oxidoreductase